MQNYLIFLVYISVFSALRHFLLIFEFFVCLCCFSLCNIYKNIYIMCIFTFELKTLLMNKYLVKSLRLWLLHKRFSTQHIQTHLVRLCSCLHGPETTSLHAPSPSLIRPALGMTSAGAQLFMVFGKKMHALSNPAFVHLVDETIEASQGSRMDGIRSLI